MLLSGFPPAGISVVFVLGSRTRGDRFWRTDPKADYDPFKATTSLRLHFWKKKESHRDDSLRLIASLTPGQLNVMSFMKTRQTGNRPASLAQAIAETGCADKTIHMLTYLDDENKRRKTLQQLNRGEGRHAVARNVFHGKRGELRQAYREGQEDQPGASGLTWMQQFSRSGVRVIRRRIQTLRNFHPYR